MTQRHKYYDVIMAFAEGKKIQFRTSPADEWCDWGAQHFPSFLQWEYRIKPATLTYRVALFRSNSGKYFVTNWDNDRIQSQKDISRMTGFVRWLTDEVEVEV